MSTDRTSQLANAESDYLSPLSYWRPAFLVDSAWHEHAPFAFWLVGATDPATIVELGTHNGFSFFVFAEAVRRTASRAEVVAIDTWEGDDHAGHYGDDVFQHVAKRTAERYPVIGRLIRGRFDQSADAFAAGTIDVLHIDGRHGYEDVAADFEAFREKLSPRAVVLFHDTAEYQEGFGVHRFVGELLERYPGFNFEHGHGLGLVAIGEKQQPAIARFLAAADADPQQVREAYADLGAEVESAYWREVEHAQLIPRLEAQIAEAEEHTAAARSDAASARDDLSAASARLTAIETSRAWRTVVRLQRLRARFAPPRR